MDVIGIHVCKIYSFKSQQIPCFLEKKINTGDPIYQDAINRNSITNDFFWFFECGHMYQKIEIEIFFLCHARLLLTRFNFWCS